MSVDPESTPTEEHGAAEDPRWLDRPGAVDKIIWALCILSAATVFADLFYHKHGHWHFQEIMGFDADDQPLVVERAEHLSRNQYWAHVA